jgi:hypothetical protein
MWMCSRMWATVAFIYREEVYNPDPTVQGLAELIIAKARRRNPVESRSADERADSASLGQVQFVLSPA